jgi:hypothetical protein
MNKLEKLVKLDNIVPILLVLIILIIYLPFIFEGGVLTLPQKLCWAVQG